MGKATWMTIIFVIAGIILPLTGCAVENPSFTPFNENPSQQIDPYVRINGFYLIAIEQVKTAEGGYA